MAATADSTRNGRAQDELRATFRADKTGDDVLAPVIAGAFARGVAETFDLLGIPALFLDRSGHIVFVNAAAESVAALDLEVRSGHLLARGDENNAIVADFLAAALRDPDARPVATLGGAGLTLRALPMPSRSPEPQLLRAIVVIGGPGQAYTDVGGST